jgi:UDP-N-acetylmuramyl pentapeptide phosphotransferase/UDP-N-acetylglucosamine-1-phosphate transferase
VILGQATSGNYLLAFSVAFLTTAVTTPLIRRYALRRGIVDRPSEPRKIHTHPIAYLGGLAIFAGFLLAVVLFMPLSRQLAALVAEGSRLGPSLFSSLSRLVWPWPVASALPT